MLVFLFLTLFMLNAPSGNAISSTNSDPSHPVDSLLHDYKLSETILCEGLYPMHLQGIITDKKANLYWSYTNVLVRTDLKGKVLNKIKVLNHHGDLCY